MNIDEEKAKAILQEKDFEFENIKEVGDDTSIGGGHTVPPPKPKPKVEPAETPKQEDLNIGSTPVQNVSSPRALHDTYDIGWYEVPMDAIPTRGAFYPDGSRLLIRPASVSVIRHFSTVDESNALELNDALDFILENLVRFSIPEMPASYKNLKELDKIAVILHVRDITFKNGESKIISDITCQCGHIDEKSLRWSDFEFFDPIDDLIRWYDSDHKIFMIKFKDPMISNIGLTLPSIGIRAFIQKYVTDRIKQRKQYDKAFANIAPYIMDNWATITNKQYEEELERSAAWTAEQFGAFVRVIDMIKKSTVSRIRHKCTKCGAEVTTSSSFRGGIKSLFIPDLQSITR